MSEKVSRDLSPPITAVTSGQSHTPASDYPFWVKELADEQANGLRLLAALKAIVEHFADELCTCGAPDCRATQARAAIAKAEGGAPSSAEQVDGRGPGMPQNQGAA